MEFLLVGASLSGIKNIKENIDIEFTNKYLKKGDFEYPYIKTIYGPNGAGKSAIIKAFELYKRIVSSFVKVDDSTFVDELKSYVNLETNTFSISISFATPFYITEIFTHKLVICFNEFGYPFIQREEFYSRNKRGEIEVFYVLNKGEFKKKNEQYIKQNLNTNGYILQSLPLATFFVQYVVAKNMLANKHEYKLALPFLLASNMKIHFGEDSDNYLSNLTHSSLQNIKDLPGFLLNLTSNPTSSNNKNHYFAVIKSYEKKTFAKYIQKLTAFINIMKPNLKKIHINDKINGDLININLTFEYRNGYKIDYDYESAGVRKLCKLFFAFVDAQNGRITFIDEIDANIHDVYLEKIISYFYEYTDCQIIITTHNARLMSSILTLKKSIDFISLNNKYLPWTKNGDLSPESRYIKGLIPYIPFNVEASDFIKVFDMEINNDR